MCGLTERFLEIRDAVWGALFFLREYFFPAGCALCGTALVEGRETRRGLCGGCRDLIEAEIKERLTEEMCGVCGKPLISEQGACLSCRAGGERAFDRVEVLFPYMGKYRRLLAAYKFGRRIDLGNFLAEKTAGVLQALIAREGLERQAALVPVPPRPGKVKESGWDQVEYLVRRLETRRGNAGGIPVLRCLQRLPSKTQKKLNREERLKNLLGRIRLSGSAPRAAVIIDDVMTTGATLDACASVLKQSGTEKVYGLCLFHG